MQVTNERLVKSLIGPTVARTMCCTLCERLDRKVFQTHSMLYARLTARSLASQQKTSIRHIDKMLNILSDPTNGFSMHNCPHLFEKLPSALSYCAKVIQLRSTTLSVYQRKAPRTKSIPRYRSRTKSIDISFK